jgi:phage baseplate assembly protein W
MPLERVSKPFKDVSLTLQSNPLTRDILTITNERAIARSIRNLVLTQKGERFFNSQLGSEVSRLLFENLDRNTSIFIRNEIEYVITTFEPRVTLLELDVNPNYDENQFDIVIKYKIIGIDVPTQQLSFALTPTR